MAENRAQEPLHYFAITVQVLAAIVLAIAVQQCAGWPALRQAGRGARALVDGFNEPPQTDEPSSSQESDP